MKDETFNFKDWFFTWSVEKIEWDWDLSNCDLCSTRIRFLFQIENKATQECIDNIWSECIKKFWIEWSEHTWKAKREYLEKQRQWRIWLNLCDLDNEWASIDIENFFDFQIEKWAFTPKQLLFLFWQYEKNDVEFKKSDYKILFRRNKDKDQFYELEEWKRKKLKACLSPQQLKDFY